MQTRTAFLSTVSHELRTPITAMVGMAELLGEGSLTEEQRRYVEILANNGANLLNLVNDILDFTQAETGHLKLDYGDFDLADLAESVVEMLAPQAQRKGLELSAFIAADVPAVVIGDRRRVGQILINLAGNAIKFTATGEAATTVEREPQASGMIRVSVIDTGLGIDPSEHERIFTNYAQAARASAQAGSGLGLAIVRQLAELMGGRVWLESTPGQGSSFHCSLRMGYQAQGNANGDRDHGRMLAGQCILLMSGAAHQRRAVASTLIAQGATVKEAANPDEAAAALANTPAWAQAVLADWPAGVNDYASVLNALKAILPAEIPIIAMLPINSGPAHLTALRTVGVNRYLMKPVRRIELIAAVASVLDPGGHADRLNPPAVTVPSSSESPPALPPLRILLADDTEDNRVLIEAYLRDSGCRLDRATTGTEAIGQFKAVRYDVILMDLHMPEIDGYEAIRQIRSWEQRHGLPRTPIIALTAAAPEDSLRESLEAGCDSHLSKPLKRSTLFSTLREVISAGRERPT